MANHLWQSTVVAAAIGALTLAFRKNAAAVRHGLWLAASVKFLVPFGALVALGSLFGFRAVVIAPAVEERQIIIVAKDGHPSFPVFDIFSAFPLSEAAPSNTPSGSPTTALVAAAAVWTFGSLVVLAVWTLRWRRVAAIAHAAAAIDGGRVVD
ncbi:MAG TPA: hypothetical protein VGY57_05980, partial [Vicinamibacterales bacterium]|nr:hypothetical protein [Vicinamibacterales bacterium]